MYENVTYEVLLKRMLERVPDTIDKREGSVIFDALAPAAAELAQMYIEADVILNETFADSASRDFLIKRAAERGIVPAEAANAILKGVFNIDVPLGARFSLGNLNYVVIEKIKDCEFKLKCETAGADGNRYFGMLIPVEYIEGLNKAEITELLISGEDEEDTEELRARYFATLDSQAFGGNMSDYKEKVNQLQGVGGIKIYPVWDGGGTVKLVIISSQFQKPSSDLIDSLQTQIDPLNSQGEGVGFAPIGHVVTVVGVTEQKVNITLNLTYREGWNWQDAKGYVDTAIDNYFTELSKGWADSDNLIVRISQIETRLLEIEGIVDISGTKINGVEQNLMLDKDSIPVRGDVIG